MLEKKQVQEIQLKKTSLYYLEKYYKEYTESLFSEWNLLRAEAQNLA